MILVMSSYLSGDSVQRRLDWLLPAWLENYDAFMQSSDESMGVVAISTAVNFGILFVCIIWFSIERYFRPRIYSPLYYLFPSTAAEPLPSAPIFGWMVDLWNIEEDTIIEKVQSVYIYHTPQQHHTTPLVYLG